MTVHVFSYEIALFSLIYSFLGKKLRCGKFFIALDSMKIPSADQHLGLGIILVVAILPSMAFYPQRLFCLELFVISRS